MYLVQGFSVRYRTVNTLSILPLIWDLIIQRYILIGADLSVIPETVIC